MKSKKFFKKYKVYLIGGALLLFIILFVVLVIVPAIKRLNRDVDAVQITLLETEVANKKLKKIPTLKNNFDQVVKYGKKTNVLFSKNEIVNLVKSLEKIAGETDNQIEVRVLNEQNKNTIKRIKNRVIDSKTNDDKNGKREDFLKNVKPNDYFEIEITLKGDYQSFLQFIYKLERMQYYNTVTSFDLQLKEEDTGKNNSKSVISGLKNSPEKSSLLFAPVGNEEVSDTSYDAGSKKYLQSKLSVIFYQKSAESSDNKNVK